MTKFAFPFHHVYIYFTRAIENKVLLKLFKKEVETF